MNRLLDGFEGKLTSSKWATIENARQIRLCATSLISSSVLFLRKTKGAGEAPAILSLSKAWGRIRRAQRSSLPSIAMHSVH